MQRSLLCIGVLFLARYFLCNVYRDIWAVPQSVVSPDLLPFLASSSSSPPPGQLPADQYEKLLVHTLTTAGLTVYPRVTNPKVSSHGLPIHAFEALRQQQTYYEHLQTDISR
jgi:hypothetical protein